MKWNILVGSLVLGLCLSTQSFGDLLDRMLGMNYNGCDAKPGCCETNCADPGPSCGCEAACDTGCDSCKPKCRKTPLLDLLRGHCKKKSCCDNACDTACDPGCGCEAVDPACGCEAACDPGCGVEAACGCETMCAKKRCRRPLLDMLKGLSCHKKSCCDTGCDNACDPGCGCEAVDPGCGCEAVDPGCGCEAVDPGCGCENACGCAMVCKPKKRCRVSLLDRIFGKRCKKSCGGCAEPACGCEQACDPGCGVEPACGCGVGGAVAPADAPTEAQEDEVGPAPVVDPSAFLPTKRRFIQTNLVR